MVDEGFICKSTYITKNIKIKGNMKTSIKREITVNERTIKCLTFLTTEEM
jgi:hypothetical protein